MPTTIAHRLTSRNVLPSMLDYSPNMGESEPPLISDILISVLFAIGCVVSIASAVALIRGYAAFLAHIAEAFHHILRGRDVSVHIITIVEEDWDDADL